MKKFINDVKFLHDIFIYPSCLLRYVLRKKKRYESIELGKHWQKDFIDSNATNWRRGREQFIKSDNENYIRYLLKKSSRQYKTILDIGSYDGYFFDDYSSFNKIICADMFVESQELIEKIMDLPCIDGVHLMGPSCEKSAARIISYFK